LGCYGPRLGQFIALDRRSRESGNPGQPARSAALDPRFRGGDDNPAQGPTSY
jgi:hypothetical protein